jgi:hypothetical protein
MPNADAEQVEQLKKLNETMALILVELRQMRSSQQAIAAKPVR